MNISKFKLPPKGADEVHLHVGIVVGHHGLDDLGSFPPSGSRQAVSTFSTLEFQEFLLHLRIEFPDDRYEVPDAADAGMSGLGCMFDGIVSPFAALALLENGVYCLRSLLFTLSVVNPRIFLTVKVWGRRGWGLMSVSFRSRSD